MTDDTIDDTEEKAKAIGKEIGAIEDDAPEFDIQEVPDDDAPLAKSKETAEEKSAHDDLSKSQQNRRRKKEVVNKKIEAKDLEIQRLGRENEELKQWRSQVDSRLSGINKAEIEKAWADNAAIYEKAKKDSLDAFTEGDGVKHLAALEALKNADDRAKEIQRIYAQLPQKTQQAATQINPHAKADEKAKAWLERNSWYSATGTDNESILAQRLSQELINEGHDPKSDDFWHELDRKLDKADVGIVEDEDDDEPVVQTKAKMRTAPPVGGGSNRGDLKGKKTITLPTSYINMLKANGIYDDKVRLKKVLADRERILRESGQ